MSTQDCVFCKIVAGEIPCDKLYEDENAIAFLDVNPLTDGHVLVIPRKHYQFVHEIDKDVMAVFFSVISKVCEAVQKGLDSGGYNIICNNGYVAGQVVPHVHFHIVPRNAKDGLFTQWSSRESSKKVMDQIFVKIKQNL